MQHMLKYFISLLFVLCCVNGISQDQSIAPQPKDSIKKSDPYGLRIGVDLSRPVSSFFRDGYTGLELVGDYRLTDKLFLAAEIGNEKLTKQEDLYNYTVSGSYIKLGVDYNTYNNWYGMFNTIYIGGRYSFATFSQTLNSYQVFDSNRYFSPTGFVDGSLVGEEFGGLNASWLEFILGTKVELFANIYLGASVRIGFLVTDRGPDRFNDRLLWVPGFNKVTDASKFGVGYNYSISYFIPLYKKAKKKKSPEDNN